MVMLHQMIHQNQRCSKVNLQYSLDRDKFNLIFIISKCLLILSLHSHKILSSIAFGACSFGDCFLFLCCYILWSEVRTGLELLRLFFFFLFSAVLYFCGCIVFLFFSTFWCTRVFYRIRFAFLVNSGIVFLFDEYQELRRQSTSLLRR